MHCCELISNLCLSQNRNNNNNGDLNIWKEKYSVAATRRWCCSRVFIVTEECEIFILEYFGSIEGQERWSENNDKMVARGYQNCLKKFQAVLFHLTCFCVHTFWCFANRRFGYSVLCHTQNERDIGGGVYFRNRQMMWHDPSSWRGQNPTQ